jgi:hypothetical protein
MNFFITGLFVIGWIYFGLLIYFGIKNLDWDEHE